MVSQLANRVTVSQQCALVAKVADSVHQVDQQLSTG